VRGGLKAESGPWPRLEPRSLYVPRAAPRQLISCRCPPARAACCSGRGDGDCGWRGARAFPSCMRSILTELYLCHACSCHEIEERKRPGPGRGAPLHGGRQAVRRQLDRQGALQRVGGWAVSSHRACAPVPAAAAAAAAAARRVGEAWSVHRLTGVWPSLRGGPGPSALHRGEPQRRGGSVGRGWLRWAFPSCMRSILTEIYLCHACSCHEIDERKRPGPGSGGTDGLAPDSAGNLWAVRTRSGFGRTLDLPC
jgi:hypothetical protein